MTLEDHHKEDRQRRTAALAMGGDAKLSKRRASGILNARERIHRLFDDETFRESGLFATSLVPNDRAGTPADGKITGTGRIGDRTATVVAYDFTVKGASSSPISNKKMQHMKDLARRSGIPAVFLNESTGVRMPDIMGGAGMGGMNDRVRFLRQRDSPWVSGVFGYSFGSAAWHTVASDFAVFRKGSVMAVSSPALVSRATSQRVTGEDLGGWLIHAEVTGLVDAAVDTDEEAIDLIKGFLSYLPSNNTEAPPVVEVADGSGQDPADLARIVPENSRQAYDVRKVIRCIADVGSTFEIKARYAKNLTTALTRFDGRTVGIIANNPMFKAGAIDASACDKATSFIVLCDSYNIPLLFLVDQPGFLVGLEAERQKITGKVINWMNALSLATVPKVTVMMRKNYGQAYVNMGGADTADAVAAWWSAEVSFMDPRSAVAVVHRIDPDTNPDEYKRRYREMARETTGYDVARVYGVHDVLDPVDTRAYVIDALRANYLHRTKGVGEHLMSNWPTSF